MFLEFVLLCLFLNKAATHPDQENIDQRRLGSLTRNTMKEADLHFRPKEFCLYIATIVKSDFGALTAS